MDGPDLFQCKKCGEMKLAGSGNGVMGNNFSRSANREQDSEEADARLDALNGLLESLEAGVLPRDLDASGKEGVEPPRRQVDDVQPSGALGCLLGAGAWGLVYGAIVGIAWALALGIGAALPLAVSIPAWLLVAWSLGWWGLRSPRGSVQEAGSATKNLTLFACLWAGAVWLVLRFAAT